VSTAIETPIASRARELPCYGVAMRRPLVFVPPLALVLALTACAAAKDYPSLQRRPAERQTGSALPATPEAPPPPPAPPSAQLTTRLSQLVEQARAAHQRFAARRDDAARSVAAGSGSAPGSEGWAMATVALSDLESARSDAMVALAELDQLYTARTLDGDQSAVAAIAAARDQVTALVGKEDDALAALRGRMRD
jgi:hypothetical protein